MKRLYFVMAIFFASLFLGCEGASESDRPDNNTPLLELKGPAEIRLRVGEFVRDPWIVFSDKTDDISQLRVTTKSNLSNFSRNHIGSYKAGDYHISYTVTDRDGYSTTATRYVIVRRDLDDSYNDGHIGDRSYDFSHYRYNAHLLDSGKNIKEFFSIYDGHGKKRDKDAKIEFEKNSNDNSIYRFVDNELDTREYVYKKKIRFIDKQHNEINFKRFVRENESIYEDHQENGCVLRQVLSPLNTQDTTRAFFHKNYIYNSAIKVVCQKDDGSTIETYYAQGWGEVLTIMKRNNEITEYFILNQESMTVLEHR